MPRATRLAVGLCVLTAATAAPAAVLQVTGLIPARHAVAPVGAAVSITFDRALNPATVIAASLRVFGRISGPKSGAISFSNVDQTLTLTPSEPFAAGETVPVNLANTIVAADTSPLRAAGYAYAFLTQTQPARRRPIWTCAAGRSGSSSSTPPAPPAGARLSVRRSCRRMA